MKIHPHADALYRVVPLNEGTFGVEVTIPGTSPTTVSSFASEEEADAWIIRTKSRIDTEVTAKKWFQRPGRFSRSS
jgi:hypothetical protein